MKLRKLLILFFILSMPAHALAAGGLRYGALEFHPYVFIKETYNDNIFATHEDQKGNWITNLTPGLKLLLPYRGHEFTLEYNAAISRYTDYHGENTTGHNASAIADLKLGNKFSLIVKDVYAKSHESRAISASGEIEKNETNATSISASYLLAYKSKVQLDFTHTNFDFTTSSFGNRSEDLIAAYAFYRFLPKTSAFVEYDFKNVNYDDDSTGKDNISNSLLLGVTWEITENTKGTIKGGYVQIDYSLAGQENLKVFSFSADISHAFPNNSLLKVSGLRTENESPLLGVLHLTTTGTSAEFVQKLTYKTAAVVRGAYRVDDYSNDTSVRNDKTRLFGVGLKYQFKEWLGFALNYNRSDRHSTIWEREYKENSFSITVNFAL
jgi:hypothetical protein